MRTVNAPWLKRRRARDADELVPRPVIYYVRHGLTDWNVQHRLQGRHDVPLNTVGRAQAVHCGKILRDLFVRDGRKPEDVVRVVARCPTGALRTHPIEPARSEQPVTPTEVTVLPGGPMLLRGDLHITGPSGLDERETRAALCSCGSTANAPYCDGSGTCVDWPHPRGSEP